jgi:hypothetical protein
VAGGVALGSTTTLGSLVAGTLWVGGATIMVGALVAGGLVGAGRGVGATLGRAGATLLVGAGTPGVVAGAAGDGSGRVGSAVAGTLGVLVGAVVAPSTVALGLAAGGSVGPGVPLGATTSGSAVGVLSLRLVPGSIAAMPQPTSSRQITPTNAWASCMRPRRCRHGLDTCGVERGIGRLSGAPTTTAGVSPAPLSRAAMRWRLAAEGMGRVGASRLSR